MMAKAFMHSLVLGVLLASISICYSDRLHISQAETLWRLQELLNVPTVLSSWNKKGDICNTEPTSFLTVICYEESITQLHIIGEEGAPRLPHNFSIDSFMAMLARLPSLKVLTLVSIGLWGPIPGEIARLSSLEILNISSNFLYGAIPYEISYLSNLQTLILDNNLFVDRIPDFLNSFPALAVLSLRNNSLNGSLPESLSKLENVRVLGLAHNHFSGEVPDLSGLTNLQELDLQNNSLGPRFPHLSTKLVTLILRKNRFRSWIPAEISSCYQLKRLDISFNKFMGPFPSSLLSLPSITYINIAKNKFTGILYRNTSCNPELSFVDLSSNLLTGSLPNCLQSNSKRRVILYAGNCLARTDQHQHPYSLCRNEALAAGIFPLQKKQKQPSKAVLSLSIVGGVFAGSILVGLVFWLVGRAHAEMTGKTQPHGLVAENASAGYTSKLVSDARYISQTMKLGALGVPAYRAFSLEELEEATNYFDTSAFMGEGSHGQMYRGRLKDGSFVAIRCLKLKQGLRTQYFMHHIELISKLRHCHLVSAVGHCFECYLDDSSVSRLFLVFEYVPNGTLRSWSSGHGRRTLTWKQRIGAATGVAKGIQFLHAGIVPGIFSNNLKITDVLLDQNLVAKISSYNLPILDENMKMVDSGNFAGPKELIPRVKHQDKIDVYDFGVILLELIVGRPISSRNEMNIIINQLQPSITSNEAARRSVVAPKVENNCSDESIKTTMEICMRCVANDPGERPSIEDVLWNLQFAAQVQDAWQGDSPSISSSRASPASPSQLPRVQLTFQ
ncbi:hypothetical protein Nepgr_011572 [Nepenthes gracilis]|uniref:Protein kinase domain-containing protein n=1 Tax=Nepenthes gracilis TaxID=150966 RepID=A0AAD3SFR6_NEPGR|nr:hypothetical protein Nepgr_011572 [Nepenthes gracilis]